MNKNKFIFIALVLVGNFLPASLIAMQNDYLQMPIDDMEVQGGALACRRSLGDVNRIRDVFLKISASRCVANQNQKINNVLDWYQKAFKTFIMHKAALTCFMMNNRSQSAEVPVEDPVIWQDVKLQPYWFCDHPTQEKFQAKVNEILGEKVFDISKWFDDMRTFEFDTLGIPYTLCVG